MNIVETLRSLWRRWYIVVPGILLSVGLALGLWHVQTPDYQRSATQMLLPGTANVPKGANPYIYIGGLTQAADVVVRALGARNVVEDVVDDRPGIDVQVARDPGASGPLIVVTVTAPSDAEAADVLGQLVARTDGVLSRLQDEEDISAASRIKVIPVTVDTTSLLLQRNRLILAVGAGLAALLATLVLAVAVDGLVIARARRRARRTADEAVAEEGIPAQETVAVDAATVAASDRDATDDPATGTEPDDARGPVGARRRWGGEAGETGLGGSPQPDESPRAGRSTRAKRRLGETAPERARRSA